MRHRPLQSLVVLVTLTLGIGIGAAVFATINAVTFRPRVDRDPSSFVRIFSAYGTDTSPPSFPAAAAVGDYLAYRGATRSLSALSGWQHVAMTVGDLPGPTPGLLVTCEFFDVYGPIRPLAGRLLQRDDCASRQPVVVIGEGLWRDLYSASPSAVGRVLAVNGRPLSIVGVAPAFSDPSNGDKFWTPYTTRSYLQLGTDDPASPGAIRLMLDGRLRAGRSRSDVATELRVLAAQQDRALGNRRTTLFVTDGSLLTKPGNGIVVTGVVSLVFIGLACLALVACGNVVSILLAVAHARRTEMALRMALGSGRGRLAAMLLTETLALSAVSGALASVVVYRAPPLLITWITQRPPTFTMGPDWRVFLFLVVTSVLAAVVVANAPLRATFGLDLVAALRGLTNDATRVRARSSNGLMGVQVGGATALLVSALALTRLPARVASAPPHIDAGRVLGLNLHSPPPSNDVRRAYHEELRTVIRGVPGVRGVAFGSAMPIGDEEGGTIDATIGSQPRRTLPAIYVSPEYLDAFGIRVLRGRPFNAGDTDCAAALCPAIVSRETARELWPNTDPVGQRFTIAAGASLQVVGVAADASSDIAEAAQALMVYRPWTPTSKTYHPFVRFDGEADAIGRAISAAIVQRFPGSASSPETIQRALERVTDAFARIGVLVAAVAGISAILAIVGVYGVISLAARRRTKEMGIRIALGARRVDVYRAMIGGSVRPVLVGLFAGAIGATVLTLVVDRLVSAVFPIRISDPAATVFASSLLAVVATVAMVLPARQAVSVDAVAALRAD